MLFQGIWHDALLKVPTHRDEEIAKDVSIADKPTKTTVNNPPKNNT